MRTRAQVRNEPRLRLVFELEPRGESLASEKAQEKRAFVV